jgi:hypothetical protein
MNIAISTITNATLESTKVQISFRRFHEGASIPEKMTMASRIHRPLTDRAPKGTKTSVTGDGKTSLPKANFTDMMATLTTTTTIERALNVHRYVV